jgi:hypothetical protein
MIEAELERFAVQRIRYVGGLALKWVCPGETGAPDRLCLFPGGRIIFAEFKRPGRVGGLSARQAWFAEALTALGFRCVRVGSKADVDRLVAEGLGSARPPP